MIPCITFVISQYKLRYPVRLPMVICVGFDLVLTCYLDWAIQGLRDTMSRQTRTSLASQGLYYEDCNVRCAGSCGTLHVQVASLIVCEKELSFAWSCLTDISTNRSYVSWLDQYDQVFYSPYWRFSWVLTAVVTQGRRFYVYLYRTIINYTNDGEVFGCFLMGCHHQ